MKSFYSALSLLAFLLFSLVFFACKKNQDNQSLGGGNQAAILSNIGNAIILPSYQRLNATVNRLDSAVLVFVASPDTASLHSVQNAFKDAYLGWQACSSFDFGPADQNYLSTSNVNTFPPTVNLINSNIANNPSTNLNTLSNFNARGFPAFDYLLFGIGDNNDSILVKYTTDPLAANRKQYLGSLSTYLKAKVNATASAWQAGGGNYIATFVSATGLDIGSSLGQLVNALDEDLEVLKNYKIALPSGVTPGQPTAGTAAPSEIEGYYSGMSLQLAVAQLTQLQNIYLGKSAQGDGAGLDDYLTQLGDKDVTLNATIKNQFSIALSKLQALPEPLATTLATRPDDVRSAYTELQKLLVLLKTDMPSDMGIAITYGDNDGD